MIMKKVLMTLFVTCNLLISSCVKDLTIDNPNEFSMEVFWKTETDAVKGVNAIYSTLHRGPMSRWLFFITIIRSDEGYSTSPDPDLRNNFDRFIITDTNYGNIADVWLDMYIGIFRANQVLDNVPAIQMDENKKQRLLGEAKFLRGMFYYHLASIWGRVPLQLKTSSPLDAPTLASLEEVWGQVESDLTDAAAKLPTVYSSPEDLGRATKGAAYALLAKAQMQQQKYTEALQPLQWLVEGEGKAIYDLMPNFRDNFLITSENNRESVFEWQFAENLADNHDDDTDPRTGNLNYGSSLPQFFSPVGWSDGEARRWPVNDFLQEQTTTGARDPRLAATYLYNYTDERGPNFSMIYGQTFANRFGATNERIWFRKFLNDHWKNEEGYRSPNNYRFIRYADVLLMYAECLNATNRTVDAYQYVDRVRQRAGLARLTTVKPGMNKDQFLQQIKHERITELTGEGHRWNDLARWGELGPQLSTRDEGFANFVKGRHEYLAIPQIDRDINPNL